MREFGGRMRSLVLPRWSAPAPLRRAPPRTDDESAPAPRLSAGLLADATNIDVHPSPGVRAGRRRLERKMKRGASVLWWLCVLATACGDDSEPMMEQSPSQAVGDAAAPRDATVVADGGVVIDGGVRDGSAASTDATAADGGAVYDAQLGGPYPFTGFVSPIYKDDKMWLCKPGIAKNHCLERMNSMEGLVDGGVQPVPEQVGVDRPFDCVYWYPTVNRTEPATTLDFSDPVPMLAPLRSQAARFSRICNVYAPFYRQTPLNNTDNPGDRVLAYSDVVESFKHYLANDNKGRDFVLMGHSQGSVHLTRLLQEYVDDNPELRKRLISILPIGAGVTVKQGDVIGGSFKNLPLCTRADQTGCVITYAAFAADAPPAANRSMAGLESACTNPAALGGGPAVYKGSYFPTNRTDYTTYSFGAEFSEPWALYRGLFQGECINAANGARHLSIKYVDVPDDKRVRFLDFSKVRGAEVGLGLHVFDYNFAVDDLLDVVAKQAAAKAAQRP
jgi:hypothetical protein